MITPPALRPGDKVGIISTARKISAEELQPALEIIKSWGYEPSLGQHLFAAHHQFAGTDAQRLADLQSFINDPDIKAILCARGGYGTVRIIDQVDFAPLLKHPKWICGYSDVSVLHNKLDRLGIASLHCSMPINFGSNTTEALTSISDVLSGRSITYNLAPHPFNRSGTAEGRLIGGNLSMLYSQLGSPTALDTTGAILFMEDLDEYLYHIDRMMYNLARNSYFSKVEAIIVGDMSDMNDNQVPFGQSAEEIINDHVKNLGIPVCFGFPAGHLKDNRSLIMNRPATLKVGDEVKLEMHG